MNDKGKVSKKPGPILKIQENRINSNSKVVDLGYRPRLWQSECHRSKKRFTVLALHRRAGKTELAVMELINSSLKTTLPQALFAYMAPLLKQAKGIAWDRIKHYARLVPGTQINESELWIKFNHNGAKIQLYGGDNPDGLRGLRLDGVVVDEVAQIKPEVWNEIVQPALSDRKGWALFIGTPKGINLFSELFNRAKSLDDWHSASYTVYDTDALDPEEVARLRRDMPENEFSREYLCDFSAAAEDQLISIREVEDAARRHYKEHDYTYAAKVLGVDVARFGDDASVIQARQGLVAFTPWIGHGVDSMALADRVAQAITKFDPDAVFIDAGQGQGVIDRLRQLGFAAIEVPFGGRANDPHYHNKRTEMWDLMAEWIRAGGAIPNNPELKQDLATPTYFYNAKGQKCLESKDDIKSRIMRSTDPGDALALTFAFPVAPKRDKYGRVNVGTLAYEYNPYDT